MFLKIGDIKGESKDKTYKEWIDVLSWSWGLAQQGTFGGAGGGGAGKVSVHDITLSKYVDAATPDIWSHCAKGKHYPTAQLIVRKAGDKPLEYLKIKLTDVIVTSVSTGGGHGGDDRLPENVSLNFAKFEMKYTVQTQAGASGTSPEIKWDVAANAEY
jgi:type VI secretion system secreted protein Hcp